MSEEIQCYHCEKAIWSRSDCIVAMMPARQLNPLHAACYRERVGDDPNERLKYPAINRENPEPRGLIWSGLALLDKLWRIGGVLLFLLMMFYILIAGFSIVALIVGLGGLGRLAGDLLMWKLGEYKMEKLKQEAFDMYESKLPE